MYAPPKELEELYTAKVAELDGCSDNYVWGDLKNRKNEIDFFKACIKEVTKDPTLKDEIINNFHKDKEKIKSGIAKINCETETT